MIARGRGEILAEAKMSLKDYFLLLVVPGIHISTKQAYATVKPTGKENLVTNLYELPVEEWKDTLINQFEEALFPQYKVLAEIKNTLYSNGAIYASMTGSGSGIYGIFNEEVEVPDYLSEYLAFREWMS